MADPIVGTFTTAGLSPAYTPPFPNMQFGIQLWGTGLAQPIYLTQSVGGAPYVLVLENDNVTPFRLSNPGCRSFDVDYTAPGTSVPITYKIVCQGTVTGTINYLLSP
jgi:hypothetical protein